MLRRYAGRAGDRPQREYHVIDAIGKQGYPVPELLCLELDPALLGGPFLVMERVVGQSLGNLAWKEPHRLPELALLAARLLRQLHSLDPRPLIGGTGLWQAEAEAGGMLNLPGLVQILAEAGVSEVFRPLLDWLREREQSVTPLGPAIVHGDFHGQNILLREPNGSPVVIDWGTSGLADPRTDLSYPYVLYKSEGAPAIAEALLQAYEQLNGGPVADFDYFKGVSLTARLTIMVVTLVRGSAFLGVRPGIEGFLKEQPAIFRGLIDLLGTETGVKVPAMEALIREHM